MTGGDTGHIVYGECGRYVDNGDGTVTDVLTGLMWTANANVAGGLIDYPSAVVLVEDYNLASYLGYNDWRIPQNRVMNGNLNPDNDFGEIGWEDGLYGGVWQGAPYPPFTGVGTQQPYWTSTLSTGLDYYVKWMSDGYDVLTVPSHIGCLLWLVRGERPAPF